MQQLKSAINWFEIPTVDFNRAVRFYSEIYAFDMPTCDMGHIRIGNRIYLHSMN
jgi:predicted enzyme related to lactoylglutathione lyase